MKTPVPLLMLVATLFTACKTAPPQIWPGASPEVRARLGTVGVRVDVLPSHDFVFDMPDTKGEAARDMTGLGITANIRGAVESPAALFLLPAFAAGGAVYGSMAGVSAPEVRRAVEAVTNANHDCDLVTHLPEQVISTAWARDCNVVDARAGKVACDTVLVLRVISQQLSRAGNENLNPALLLHYVVSAQLTDREGHSLYHTYVQTRSRRWNFTEWAADDARHLREEARRETEKAAGKIVGRVFFGEDSE